MIALAALLLVLGVAFLVARGRLYLRWFADDVEADLFILDMRAVRTDDERPTLTVVPS